MEWPNYVESFMIREAQEMDRELNFIFDIDGTLADLTHRLHHILETDPPDYDAFYRDVYKDAPIKSVIQFAKDVRKSGHNIFFVSGRRGEVRRETELWLRKNVFRAPLYMRPLNNNESDVSIKRDILKHFRAKGVEIDVAVDDRPSIVGLWIEEEVPCVIDVGTWSRRRSGKEKMSAKPTGRLWKELKAVWRKA